jgi:spermidine synthase
LKDAPRVVRTRHGLRIVQGRDVLSHLLARPGPTGGLFDVLAAAVVAFAPETRRAPRVALLGFAAGGIVAPLRALGFVHPLHAVDLSLDAAPLFRELAADWGGEVRLVRAEASAWLRRSRRPWDVVVEDLTVPGPAGAEKPRVSVEVLPRLLRARLAPGGVAVTNVLPVPGMTWEALVARLASPYARALVVHCEEYENRILLAGAELPPARAAAGRLRATLRRLGSRQATRLAVRTHA